MLDMLGLTHKDVMFPFSDLTLFKAIDNVFPQCSWARPQKSQSGQAVTRFEVKSFIDCKPFSYKWSTWSKAGPALCRVQRGCSRLTHEMRNKTGSQFKQKNLTFLLCFYGCVERFSWEQVNTRYCEAKEKVRRVKATSLTISVCIR